MTGMETAEASALNALAGYLGVEGGYGDGTNRISAVAPATTRALIEAMGVHPDEAGAAERLAEAEAADWRRPLSPATVDRTGGRAVVVDVTLPRGTERMAWMVCLEHGGEITGESRFEDLEVVGTRAVDGIDLERRRLPLPDLPLGYHGLALNEPGLQANLIVTPQACWLPEALSGGLRTFGIALQLYLLRSDRNWGIGDFADLRRFVEIAVAEGSDLIGLNPLHALFMDQPEAASPYSPASRLLLNPLYIAVDALPDAPILSEWLNQPAVAEKLLAARASANVDYATVAELKIEALRRLHSEFRDCAGEERRRPFDDFLDERGESFRRACLFLAMREHFAGADPPRPDWRTWPEDCRGPEASGALAFRTEHAEKVDFQAWMQFVADQQLGDAATAARRAGMAIGVYRDLAVGADPAGAETWTNASAVMRGVSIGAPPDVFMPFGQNWGLPPFNPRALREEGFASFIDLVRANMRHAGGLRIDHVMGLMHLWCMPDGSTPIEGAYLRYPLDSLVGILALESHRARCMVVGEDLGTVPDGFREKMAAANVLSYRVLFFEQDSHHGTFRPGREYPRMALAVAGSHDLPTLRGWWTGADNEVKEQLGLFPGVGSDHHDRRERDRDSLVALLRADGLLPEEGPVDDQSFVGAAAAFLAETASMIAIAQLDDITGEVHQVNVPGTVHEHPNWRRKYAMSLEELASSEGVWQSVRRLRARKADGMGAPG